MGEVVAGCVVASGGSQADTGQEKRPERRSEEWLQLTKRIARSNARASISPYHKVSANKGIRWMPWHLVPMKDVVHCEKLR